MSNNIPARVGVPVEEVDTPSLVIDLDALERNVDRLGSFLKATGLRHRAHAKTHKSSDIAIIQMERGGACGVCCQKVSEAEAMVSAGVRDVLVSNQVVAPQKIERLAALAKRARILVCVDNLDNIRDLAEAAQKYGSSIECLVEIDVGAGRCGVSPGDAAVALAKQIALLNGLRFGGLQAYQGPAQHAYDFNKRKALIDTAIKATAETVNLLKEAGLDCDIVAGAGTGTYEMEGASGVYNELQCGSYIFMDVDYQRVRSQNNGPNGPFENSLFIHTSIMSKTRADHAICDAGLKAQSVDSGMPVIFGRPDLTYVKCSDEHGVISDPGNVLKLNEKLLLVPSHCDPTVNLYDWYVCVRNRRVEALWPVTARGMVL